MINIWKILSFIAFHWARDSIAQMDGWKMTDRFYGFRYKIRGESAEVIQRILKAADNLGCFGWIQNPTTNIFVGEARCPKMNGEVFEKQITSLNSEDSLPEIKVRIISNQRICRFIQLSYVFHHHESY